MYIVGIDIGKNHHEASIVSPEGKQIGRMIAAATILAEIGDINRFKSSSALVAQVLIQLYDNPVNLAALIITCPNGVHLT